MACVWELQRRPGKIGDDWQKALFKSKDRANQAAAGWLKEGYSIAGPYRRAVY